MTESTTDEDIDLDEVTKRSEIVFLLEARNANPNGNPQSGENRPRTDPQTRQGVITDARMKRYFRDQLEDDGHEIFIKNTAREGEGASSRKELFKSILEPEIGEVEDADEVDADLLSPFLNKTPDTRMFGAAVAITSTNDEVAKAIEQQLPNQLTGPIQFKHGRSIHPVVLNEESAGQSSVVATGEEKNVGAYNVADHRVKYGLYRFSGAVNEYGASTTNLRKNDVERLDTLVWRAVKNQTYSRSKSGQEPRFYLRVEYDEDRFHDGDLYLGIQLDEDRSAPVEEMRNVTDACIDATLLIRRLEKNRDRIDTVHLRVSDMMEFSVDGEAGNDEFIQAQIRDAVGEDNLHLIDVYEESSVLNE